MNTKVSIKKSVGHIGSAMLKDRYHLKIETPENNSESGKPLRRGWILAALMMTMMLAAMDNTIIST